MARATAVSRLDMEVTAAAKDTTRVVAPFAGSEAPGLFDRAAWRDAALIWLGQRVLLGALIVAGMRLLGLRQRGWGLLHILANWDGDIYRNIASGGYTHLWQAAFFPLFPLLEHVLGLAIGGNTALAGVIISNAASLLAFGLLRVLVERELGPRVARRTLLYLALFPVSCFLVAAYAESLFLLLSVGAYLALRRERWLAAGTLIALATLTRPVGVILEVALVTQFFVTRREVLPPLPGEPNYTGGSWRDWARPLRSLWLNRREIAVPLLLPVLAGGGFCLYLYPRFHTLTAPSVAENTVWGRRLSWPWDGFVQAAGAMTHGAFALRLHAGLDIAFTLVFLALVMAALRRLPLCYSLPICATATLALLTPMHVFDWAGLGSTVRFMLVEFPLFMLLAWWGVERRRLHLAIVACSLLLLVLLILEFVGGAFVA